MNKLQIINSIYYQLKPLLPRRFQLWLRSMVAIKKRDACISEWPILEKTAAPPDNWPGWPENKQFALVLTHDVDTALGHQRCHQLMQAEEQLGFRSSFNFVPERYHVSAKLREHLTKHGFEVGVHGLNHDGKLFQTKKIFEERSVKINRYLKEWNSVGFRAPAVHHNLEWIGELEIEYDASTFDTDPFQPQPDAIETIFPFCVEKKSTVGNYIELPYTLSQDFILFILLKKENIDIWKTKLDWIAEKGGMALLVTHPDYMAFDNQNPGMEEYPVEYYLEFLDYIKTRYASAYWPALPREVAAFVKRTNYREIYDE